MRSAELVWGAQPIACCGEIGGIGRRGEIAQRRVRALLVVIIGPIRDLCPGMIEAEEQALIEQLVPHPAVDGEDGPAPDKGPYTGPTLQKGAFR